MNISRRTFFTATAIAGAGTMTACSSNGSQDTASQDSLTFQAGYEVAAGEPADQAMQKWAELLEQRSGGSMKMELFPSSQLGSKTDLLDQMRAGSPVITLADGAFFAEQGAPDFGITMSPYIFDNWEQAFALMESDWWAEQADLLHDNGLSILANWKYGDRNTLLTEQISGVDDLAGRTIRVPDNTIQIKGMEALGAAPTPMAYGEIYSALQQGVIDGLENPIPALQSDQFHEVAKYLVLSEHVRTIATWVTGSEIYDSLSTEQKEILSATGAEAGLLHTDLYDEAEGTSLATMEEEGVTVIEADIEAWRNQAESFYEMPEVQSMWSEGLYDTVKAAME